MATANKLNCAAMLTVITNNAVNSMFHLKSVLIRPVANNRVEALSAKGLGKADKHSKVKIGTAITHCSPKTIGT